MWDFRVGEGFSTCAWNCLQLAVQPDQLEARGVPGAAPGLGLAPGCGEALQGPLQLACHFPRTGRTTGPSNGSVPAQRGPSWGLSPLPSPRPHIYTGQLADDSLGAPLLGETGQRLWFQLLFPPEHSEDCALEEQGRRGGVPALSSSGPEGIPHSWYNPHLKSSSISHSSLLLPSPLPPPETTSLFICQLLEEVP